jgi:hypothetical protein
MQRNETKHLIGRKLFYFTCLFLILISMTLSMAIPVAATSQTNTRSVSSFSNPVILPPVTPPTVGAVIIINKVSLNYTGTFTFDVSSGTGEFTITTSGIGPDYTGTSGPILVDTGPCTIEELIPEGWELSHVSWDYWGQWGYSTSTRWNVDPNDLFDSITPILNTGDVWLITFYDRKIGNPTPSLPELPSGILFGVGIIGVVGYIMIRNSKFSILKR